MEKVANLLAISTSFLSPYFSNRLFWVHGVAKLVFVIVSVVLEAVDLPAPILLSSLFSPLLPRLLFEQIIAGFHPSALFHVFEIFNDFTVSFGSFSLFMIPFTRGIYWLPVAFTPLTN